MWHVHLWSAEIAKSDAFNSLELNKCMINHLCFSLQSLHAQKSDNQKMKAKLRRLEEDNAKREKQIEELLDPTKVRSLNSFSVLS